MRINRETGTIMEPPIACKILIQTNISREVDKAQASDPKVKIPTAIMKIFRDPNLSESHPLKGINKAKVKV